VTRLNVMQVVDSLDVGGAERVAVNFANLLPRDRFSSVLCTTRKEGPLASLVCPHVARIALGRRSRFDLAPLRRLAEFVVTNDIQIIHAHSSALFVGLAASLLQPSVAVIWHVHHPHHATQKSPWVYRIATKRVAAVLVVSQPLVDWAERRVGVSPDRVLYLPNFSLTSSAAAVDAIDLPGEKGRRIACLANLRPQKDHATLLRAMAIVVRRIPDAHLLLIGGGTDGSYRTAVSDQIARDGLNAHVSLLGERLDVAAILGACDIGVLSSETEGFPLALVEYGHAGLPVVATRVGQCADVLDNGTSGRLVDRHCPDQLADEIVSLLESAGPRRALGETLRRRVQDRYGSGLILQQICGLYERVARTAVRNELGPSVVRP
jgi:glycosyltransferase involved in cell wall biosynthesis